MIPCARPTLALVFLTLALPAQSFPQDLIAVDFAGQAFTLNSRTGNGQPLGTTGSSGHGCMARAGRQLYTVERVGSVAPFQFFLNTVDDVTGAASRSVAVARDLRALAATGSQGILLGIAEAGQSDDLVRVEVLNGAVTTIGPTGFSALQGLTLHGNVFYGWDLNAGLMRIDHLTGAATDVNPAVGTGGASIQFLTTMTDGRLLGGHHALYEIDVATGQPTLRGSGQFNDLRGAEERFGVAYVFGQGCAGVDLTLTGEARAGATVTTTSAGHRRLTPAFLLLGFSDRHHATGLPLPLRLDAILGTAGCFLYTSGEFTVGTSATSGGLVAVPVSIPLFSNGLIFHVQHVALNGNAPGGLAFSPGGTVRVRL